MSDMSANNPPGLSEEDYTKRISNTVDMNNLPNITAELEVFIELLQDIMNKRSFNSAELARLSTQFAKSRGAIEEAKKILIVKVGNQKDDKLQKLGMEAQNKTVQREYLASIGSDLQNAQETASNTSKNVGVDGVQQIISMLQKIINIINELKSIANKGA